MDLLYLMPGLLKSLRNPWSEVANFHMDHFWRFLYGHLLRRLSLSIFIWTMDQAFLSHTVGKKTVRMFVNIQRLLNKSRTIEVTDLKFSGYTVLYVVYWPWKNHDININISHTINKTLIKHIRTVFLLLCCNSQYKIFHVQFYSCWPLNGFELNYISLLMNPNREQLKSTWFPYVLH